MFGFTIVFGFTSEFVLTFWMPFLDFHSEEKTFVVNHQQGVSKPVKVFFFVKRLSILVSFVLLEELFCGFIRFQTVLLGF